jgi:hypothetical protein
MTSRTRRHIGGRSDPPLSARRPFATRTASRDVLAEHVPVDAARRDDREKHEWDD